MKKLVAGVLMASMMMSLAGCAGGSKTDETKLPDGSIMQTEMSANNLSASLSVDKNSLGLTKLAQSDADSINSDLAVFSINLMKEAMNSEESGTNVLMSPMSVLYALGMTGNGANGDTREQFENVLVGGQSMDKLNCLLAEKLPGDDQLSLANSIWIRNNSIFESMIREEFLSLNKYVYDADTVLAPFDDSTVNDVNNWVSDKTNGMIPSVLSSLSDTDVMLLINAACFDAKWMSEYEEDDVKEEQIFTNYLGEEETVTMLSSKEGMYFETENSTGFGKLYEDGKYAFVGILPNEGVDLNDYVNSLTGESWINMYQDREYYDVYVNMPEFSYDYDKELSQMLETMGMPKAFSAEADFSNMADISGGDSLYIGSVIHKTHIEVDRNGTKAAAATVVAMTFESADLVQEIKWVNLDRPFLYAIVEVDTGLPVFMGTVNSCK